MSTKEYLDSDGLATFATNINTTFAKKAALTDETTARTAADTALDTRVSTLESAGTPTAVKSIVSAQNASDTTLTVTKADDTTLTVKLPTPLYKSTESANASTNSTIYGMQKYKYTYYDASGNATEAFNTWIPCNFVVLSSNNAGKLAIEQYDGSAADGNTLPTARQTNVDIKALLLDIYEKRKKVAAAKVSGTYVLETGETIHKIATICGIGWQSMTDLTAFPFSFDFSSVTDFSYMFNGCAALTTLPTIDTSNGTDFSYMFNGCAALTTLPTIDISGITDRGNFSATSESESKIWQMVADCPALAAVDFHHDTITFSSIELAYFKYALVGSDSGQKNVTFS